MYIVLFFSPSLVWQPFPLPGTSFTLFLNRCKAKSYKFFPFFKMVILSLDTFQCLFNQRVLGFCLILHTDLPRLEVFSLLLNNLSIAPKCPSSTSPSQREKESSPFPFSDSALYTKSVMLSLVLLHLRFVSVVTVLYHLSLFFLDFFLMTLFMTFICL